MNINQGLSQSQIVAVDLLNILTEVACCNDFVTHEGRKYLIVTDGKLAVSIDQNGEASLDKINQIVRDVCLAKDVSKEITRKIDQRKDQIIKQRKIFPLVEEKLVSAISRCETPQELSHTVESIENTVLKITDFQRLFIAEKCLDKLLEKKQDSFEDVYIEHFNFNNKMLLEFFDLVLIKSPQFFDHLPFFFSKLKFNSERLHEIADEFLNKFPVHLIKHIEAFQLNPEKRFEIAFQLAINHPYHLIDGIEKFRLNDEELSKIADQILEIPDHNHFVLNKFLDRIEKFHLNPEKLSKIGARILEIPEDKNHLILQKFLKNIPRQPLNYEFANQLLEKFPDVLLHYVDAFKLSDEERDALANQLVEIMPLSIGKIVANFRVDCGFMWNRPNRLKMYKRAIEIDHNVYRPSISSNFLDEEELLSLSITDIIHHPLLWLESTRSLCSSKNEREKIFQDHSRIAYFVEPERALEDRNLRLCGSFLDEIAQDMIRQSEGKEELKWTASTLLKWLGYVEMSAVYHQIDEIGIQGEVILKRLTELRMPSLRYEMTQLLFAQLRHENSKECLEAESLTTLFPGKFGPLFHLALTPLLSDSFSVDELKDVITILNSEYFEEQKWVKIILTSLLALMKLSSLNHADKIKILKIACQENDLQEIHELEISLEVEKEEVRKLSKREQKSKQSGIQSKTEEIRKLKKTLYQSFSKNLQIIEILINMKRTENLGRCKDVTDLEFALKDAFIQETGVGEVENFTDKYLSTFASFRQPEGIFIYLGKLKNLPPLEMADVMAAANTYIESTLNGALSALRYQEEPGDHLSTVFKGRGDLKVLWMQGDRKDLNAYLSSSATAASSMPFDVHQCMRQWIDDKHIPDDKFPLLTLYLSASLDDSSMLTEILKDLDKGINSGKDVSTRNLWILQKGILSLLIPNQSDDIKRIIFNESIGDLIEAIFPEEDQFKQDLKDLGVMLQDKRKNKIKNFKGWSVVDTDDSQDLLMCGTDVPGSCQRIDGVAKLNKCLLGYLLDGKNRLVAVKNEKGVIVARAIMRLLWDQNNQVPVLFKERIYSQPNLDPKIFTALDQMFIERAETLGLSLVENCRGGLVEGSTPYPNPLYSLNSKAPFEYVDATCGVTNGQFTVSSSSYLHL